MRRILIIFVMIGLILVSYQKTARSIEWLPYSSFSMQYLKFNAMQEIWKDVEGYEGLYQVSNLGKVKGLNRVIKHRKGFANLKEKELKITTQKIGYLAVNLCKDGVVKLHNVHRLMANAFIPNPENKPEVNHKNGIKHDCRLKNLEWVTRSENHIHSYEVLNQKKSRANLGRFGRYHNNTKAVLMYDENDNLIIEFGAISEAAEYFKKGRGSAQISRACNGKSKTAYGYKWKWKNKKHERRQISIT